ncbi:MAG: hypothetical protein K6F05_09200 [Succinivibrio sp.]|nr:hypothetical protein [Succinivibrio sp.]
MERNSCLILALVAGVMSSNAVQAVDIQNPVPEQLQKIGERINYPQALCAVKSETQARDMCLPGEILWYAPEDPHADEAGYKAIEVVAKYCNLREQVFHNADSVVCIYQPNAVTLRRDQKERIPEPKVPTLNQQYNAEISKILNESPDVTSLQDNMWMQVVNEGRLSGEPFKRGTSLLVEVHLLSPRFEDDGSGHVYLEYTYEEAEKNFLLSTLNQYWNSVDADVLVYSDVSWLPKELQSKALFGSQTLRAYHVIFKGLVEDDEEHETQNKGTAAKK